MTKKVLFLCTHNSQGRHAGLPLRTYNLNKET